MVKSDWTIKRLIGLFTLVAVYVFVFWVLPLSISGLDLVLIEHGFIATMIVIGWFISWVFED